MQVANPSIAPTGEMSNAKHFTPELFWRTRLLALNAQRLLEQLREVFRCQLCGPSTAAAFEVR